MYSGIDYTEPMKSKIFINCVFCQKIFPKKFPSSKTKYCCRHCQSKDLFKKGISGRKKTSGKNIICAVCETLFYVEPHRIKRNNVKYCSRSCLAKDLLKPYRVCFVKSGKPKCKYKSITVNGKRFREHRWIMEQHVGRKLHSWEHVHHINGESLDNRIENLVILSNAEHQKIHIKERINSSS